MSKGDQTREMILEKSAELFNTLGYEGCSMNDIMEATGLGKGGIYNHFKNKNELAIGAFEYSFKAVISRFRLRLDHDKTNWDKIISVIEIMTGFYKNPVIIGGDPLFNTAMDSVNTHPMLREKAREGLENLRKYLEIKIADGIEMGEFIYSGDPSKTASLILMTLEGGLAMSRLYEDETYIITAAEYVKSHLSDKLL